MAKVVAPILARVEMIGKPKEGQYGTYCPVLFMDANLGNVDEAKIWKNMTPEEVEPLRKGAVVQLVPAGQDKQGKPKHNIVLTNSPQASAPKPASWTAEEKRAIAAKVQQNADLMKFCYQTAVITFQGVIDDPSELRAIATTLFIQSSR